MIEYNILSYFYIWKFLHGSNEPEMTPKGYFLTKHIFVGFSESVWNSLFIDIPHMISQIKNKAIIVIIVWKWKNGRFESVLQYGNPIIQWVNFQISEIILYKIRRPTFHSNIETYISFTSYSYNHTLC